MQTVLTVLVFSLSFLSVSTSAQSDVPMTLQTVGEFGGAQLLLPCGFGNCMIDTGGGGNMVHPGPSSNSIASARQVTIDTVIGKQQCDFLVPIAFELAGVSIPQVTFLRCPNYNGEDEPMIGLPIFMGKVFSLNFSTKTFQWLSGQDALPLSLHSIPNANPLAIDVTLGGTPNVAQIDTGAATTLVDISYVNKHPEQFSAPLSADLPPGAPPEMGFRNLLVPLTINGLKVSNTTVMVLNMKGTVNSNGPDIVLGMNQLMEFNWKFDLAAGRYSVSKSFAER